MPWAKRTRSESEMPAVVPEVIICETSAYGTVKVVMRIARFRLIVYPTLKKVERNHEEAGRQRALSQHELEVEAEQEQDRAERDGVQELRDDAAGEFADPEELEVEQGVGVPALEHHEDGETDERRCQKPDHGPRLGDPVRRQVPGEQEAHDKYGEGPETAPVNRRPLLELPDFAQPEAGPRGAEDPNRHVHVEQRAPIEEREDDAAERQARHGTHAERDLVDPEGQAELLRRGRVDDHRRAVREQNRGAETLDRPEGDHLGRVDRQARQERADREQDRKSTRLNSSHITISY